MECKKHEHGEIEMKQLQIDIIGINKLRWIRIGHSEYHFDYYSGHKKERKGVAFIVRKDIARTLFDYNTIYDWIILIRLCGHPFNMKITLAYAPTSSTEEEIMSVMIKFNLKSVVVASKMCYLWLETGILMLEIQKKKLVGLYDLGK